MPEEGFIYVCNFSDSLAILVTPNPGISDSEMHPLSSWLEFTFDAEDKEGLFFDALQVFNPAAAVGGRLPTQNHESKWAELMAQFERSVEQATATLPLLRRFKEEYEGVTISPDEVGRFREECLSVRKDTNEPRALSALDKLISACDVALKDNLGLLFASD
ncbi:MAG: hypothetical protein ACJ74W_21910 [Pyrinomonadaceae bacterium]